MWTKIILLLEGKRVPTYLSSLQWLLSCPAQVTSTQHLSLLFATALPIHVAKVFFEFEFMEKQLCAQRTAEPSKP